MNIIDLLPSFQIYLEHERKLAEETRIAYRCDLRGLGKFTGLDVKDITSETLRAYMRHMSQRGLAVRTIRRRFNAFSTFWYWMKLEHLVDEVITEGIQLPKVHRKTPPWLNERQLQLWVTTPAPSLRDDLAWKTLAWFGLRRGELLNLLIRDVKLDMRILLIRNAKDGSDRSLAIPDQLLPEFSKLMGSRPRDHYLFEDEQGGQWRKRAFRLAFIQHVTDCGLQGKGITPHVLRHTFATHLCHRGVPTPTVQTLLGHKHLSSTEIYSHAASEWLNEAMSKHPLNDTNRRTT